MTEKNSCLEFDKNTSRWKLGENASGFDCNPLINGQKLSLKNAKDIRTSESKIIARFNNPQLTLSLDFEFFEEKQAASIIMEITNIGSEAITVGNSCIFSMDSDSDLNIASDTEKLAVFNFLDTLADNYVHKITYNKGMHKSRQLCHIFDTETGKTFFAGNLTFDKMPSECELLYNEKNGKIESINYTMLFNDFKLEPGKTLSSEKIYIEIAAEDPYRVLEDWAGMVRNIYNPNIPVQSPSGWVGWAWIDGFKMELPESIVERNSKAVKERLGGFDIPYLWISISNLKNGLPGNWLVANETFYPNGLDETIEKVKNRGFKPGFWIAPFYQCEGSETFEENFDNTHKDKDGIPIPRQGWLWAANAKDKDLPHLHYLDPSHPNTVEFIEKVFAEYRKRGIRYYMLDFLHAGRLNEEGVAHDPSYVKPWEAYRKCMEKIRETSGPDTHLLTAVGSTLGHVGTVSASRIGLDYGEGRQLMPRFPSYPATYIVNGSYGSAGSPNRNAVNNMACWFFAHRNFFLCDSNILTVDKPIPRNEAEISATLFGISGGPMMIGDDIDRICEERLIMVKKCLPRGNSTPFPATLFSKLDSDDHSHVFVVTVEKPWGKWYVVALFNLNNELKEFNLEAENLRLSPEKKYRLFDFWQESYQGLFKKNKTVTLLPNSAAVFRFEEEREHPWLLSTDMHVRQGEAELLDLKWNEENLTLSGKATRPAGEKGNLYICAPWDWKLKDFTEKLWIAKSGIDETLIIRKEIVFDSDTEEWEIAFERFTEEEIEWRNKNKKKFSE